MPNTLPPCDVCGQPAPLILSSATRGTAHLCYEHEDTYYERPKS